MYGVSTVGSNKSYWINESSSFIEIIRGEEIVPLVARIAELRIEYFAAYPYFYQGNLESEMKYLSMYLKKENVIWTIAKKNDQIVGVVTGIPLKDAEMNFQQPFIDKSIDVKEIFYLGDIILQKEFRGMKIGAQLYAFFEQEVCLLGSYKKICFCEIATSINDPGRPLDYHSMNTFWFHRGYRCYEDMIVSSLWKNIGEEKDSLHQMVVSIKDL